VRIESVRFDASGNPTIVVTGGISFFVPIDRVLELVEAIGADRGEEGAHEAERPRTGAELKSFLLDVAKSDYEFGEEAGGYAILVSIDAELRARRKALELCARAEQSSAGLQAKLVAKGFSRQIARAVIQALATEGVVDDARYARVWARGRAERRAAGPALLAAELRSRGQGEDAVRGALEDIDFSRVLARAALRESAKLAKAWEKKGLEPNRRFKEELYRILKRQGFDPEKIAEEIKKMEQDRLF